MVNFPAHDKHNGRMHLLNERCTANARQPTGG